MCLPARIMKIFVSGFTHWSGWGQNCQFVLYFEWLSFLCSALHRVSEHRSGDVFVVLDVLGPHQRQLLHYPVAKRHSPLHSLSLRLQRPSLPAATGASTCTGAAFGVNYTQKYVLRSFSIVIFYMVYIFWVIYLYLKNNIVF